MQDIPISFNSCLPKPLPRNVIVRSIYGKVWKLKLRKCGGDVEKYAMVGGWKRIVKDEDLKGGEFLTFEFDGSRLFNFCVYGHATCKRLANSVKTKETEDEPDVEESEDDNSSVEIVVIDSDDDDDDDDYADDDGDEDEDGDDDDEDSGGQDIIAFSDDDEDDGGVGDQDKSSEDVIVIDDDDDDEDDGDQDGESEIKEKGTVEETLVL